MDVRPGSLGGDPGRTVVDRGQRAVDLSPGAHCRLTPLGQEPKRSRLSQRVRLLLPRDLEELASLRCSRHPLTEDVAVDETRLSGRTAPLVHGPQFERIRKGTGPTRREWHLDLGSYGHPGRAMEQEPQRASWRSPCPCCMDRVCRRYVDYLRG
jgi:hypothetical protein